MKSNIFLIAFILISSFCYSQDYDISGTVTEAQTGLGLPGANVSIKNGTQQTTADLDGKFSLANVPSGSTLIISYVGFETKEVSVTSNQTIAIALETDSQSLDEVVVIGYGTQKKKEVTGAIGTVSSTTIEKFKPQVAAQALQGTVAGVQVGTNSGSPGAGYAIRIRGVGSNGNAQPLAIIDGYIGDFNLLNPNDIESISILKDASVAIYGTVGANGVILVTTKSGKKNSKPTLSYSTYTGFQETSRKLPMLNATEYALLLNESYANGGQPIPYPNVSGLGKGTDWQDEVFSKGVPIINHDLSFSGGSEKISYYVSGSHLDQEGIVGEKKSGFLRNTARLALNADITDRLKLNTNIIYTYFNRKNLNENGLGSVLFNALNTPSTLDAYDANGDFTLVPNTTGLGNEIINPMAQIANTYNDYNYKKINGTFGLKYELAKGLNISATMGFNSSNSESRVFAKQISYGGKVFDVQRSSVTQGAVNDNNYSFDLYAEYKKSINESHNFTGTIGTTVFKEWGNGLTATGFDVPNNAWENADISLTTGISDTKTNSSYAYDERRNSLFGRLQYDFKGKYLFSAMLRRDSSTKFGPDNTIAYFPSFTAGWIVSEEGFFGDGKLINFLKLRGSYGRSGSDLIRNNVYNSLLTGEATYVFDGTLTNGVATGIIPNPQVRWEEARMTDVGFDMKLFNNKVEVNADYFSNVRENLLIDNVPVSGIIGIGAPGASAPTKNVGTVKNYGLELAVGYHDNIGEDFSFDVNYNVTFIKNKTLRVDNGTGFVEGGAFGVGQPMPSRMEVGLPIGFFYGYQTDGIFQNQAEVEAHPSQVALGAAASPGDIRFKDINGDGVIDTKDRTNLGDPIPAATMGFNFTLNYKGFDLGVFSYASIGNDMVRNYERVLSDANRSNYVLGRWTGEGTSNSVPRVTTAATSNNVFSDYFVEDASYLRLSRVEIGYNFDKAKILDKAGITRLRLYVNANNLLTLTKYRGYDPAGTSMGPEASSIGNGIDYGYYPVPRIFILGANINF